jgi:antitoxin MazE
MMFTKLSERGSIVIPEELREALGSARVFEVVRRDDGVIELRPQDTDERQSWFWSDRWQEREREADEDFTAGRISTFDDIESFLADLDTKPAE